MPKNPILSRKSAHRTSMLRNIATSLVLYERISTTLAKAKAARGLVEHWIITALPNSVAARRLILKDIRDPKAVDKIFEVLVKRYANRHGGYTRITRTHARLGDAAPMVKLELVDANTATISEKSEPTKDVDSEIKTDEKTIPRIKRAK